MKQLYSVLMVLASAALAAFPASAHPIIAALGIRNAGSYALPGLPNAGIAQGSLFIVFGQDLGPAKIVQVSSYPLPTSARLAGTSIKVTSMGPPWTPSCFTHLPHKSRQSFLPTHRSAREP